MKTTILGVNEINYLHYTYCETIDENLMYVEINAQSDRKKTSQDFVLLFSKEQVIEMYESMMKQEKTNSKFLKP
jgi:hypothetical protein